MVFLRSVLVCLCTAIPALAFGQSSLAPQIDVKNLESHIDHFLAYDQELTRMKSTLPPDEVKIADSLTQLASQTADHFMAIETMINMFNNIESKTDRDRTRPILFAYLRLNSDYSEKQAARIAMTSGQSRVSTLTQIAFNMKNEVQVSVLTLKTIAIMVESESSGK
jgi:hypothetical protein